MSYEINSEEIEHLDPKYTDEYSEEEFWKKIKSVLKSAGLTAIYKALQLYYVMLKPECPMHIKAAIITTLGYFISPIDLIPDAIPVVGFSDDIMAISSALIWAQCYVDEEVKRNAKAIIDKFFGHGTSDELN